MPKRKLVKWINIHDKVWKCTGCNLMWFMATKTTPKQNEMNYCPKCGYPIEEAEPEQQES